MIRLAGVWWLQQSLSLLNFFKQCQIGLIPLRSRRQAFAHLLAKCSFVCLIGYSNISFAHIYMATVDQATWNVEASPLMCSIWHNIPGYGLARFRHRAGERLQFRLETKRKVVNDQVASLMAEPPNWKSYLGERDLGSYQTQLGKIPLLLKEPRSSRLLAELQIGMILKPVLNRDDT